MTDRQKAWMPRELENPEAFFRAISPDDYARLGIDPQDVPVGTFAAHDHPTFLPSRAGGNAYGLGLIEQSSLNRADLDFLEGIDFQNLAQLRHQARQINSIYRKLGVTGRREAAIKGRELGLIPGLREDAAEDRSLGRRDAPAGAIGRPRQRP